MVKLIKKSVQNFFLKDISMEFLCQFYEIEHNRNVILQIFDYEKYFTNIAYEEILNLTSEDDLVYFLQYICREKVVKNNENAQINAEKILKNNPYIHFVFVNKIDDKSAFFYSDIIFLEKEYNNIVIDIKSFLKKKNIYTYIIRIPTIDDINKEVKHEEWKYGYLSAKINWTKYREDKMKKYLNKFTELEYLEAKENINRSKEILGGQNETRTIFLVGPCIVGGWESFPGEALSDVLYNKLMAEGLDFKVVNVLVMKRPSSKLKLILEYNIKQNDIVLFIEDIFDRKITDINLDSLYNNYKGIKWLYSDIPIHTTQTGNSLISKEIIEKIIKPVDSISKRELDKKILHKGEMQLTYEESIELEEYLKQLNKYTLRIQGKAGACVMTCNPFTKGHFYLIEYASKQVDLLYVFIVEEDSFFFSFKDRIEMVYEGTKKLKNVVVLPSGKYIISKGTFKHYFEKEIYKDIIIDVKKDMMIFHNYIAPLLKIRKRFVGEEPEDNITKQYNEQLKKHLSDIMEIVEIPRVKIDKNIISASRVRHYFKEENWKSIEKMVPWTTLEYLKNNKGRLKINSYINDKVDKIIDFIQNHNQIIICGLGKDAKYIMNILEDRLRKKDIDKIKLYDKKANLESYFYRGKKVISFETLINKYKDYYMIITTSKYKKDIFSLLIKNGVKANHVIIFHEYI